MAGCSSEDAIQLFNEKTLQSLEIGDLVEFKRGLYSHWAVYIGDGEVVHLSGDDSDGLVDGITADHLFTVCGKSFSKAYVKVDDFWDVTLGCRAYKNNSKDLRLQKREPEEIREHALSKRGFIGYNVLFKNCEHFASWCRYQVEKSDQVQSFFTALAVGGATLATLGIAYGMSKKSKEEVKNETSK